MYAVEEIRNLLRRRWFWVVNRNSDTGALIIILMSAYIFANYAPSQIMHAQVFQIIRAHGRIFSPTPIPGNARSKNPINLEASVMRLFTTV